MAETNPPPVPIHAAAPSITVEDSAVPPPLPPRQPRQRRDPDASPVTIHNENVAPAAKETANNGNGGLLGKFAQFGNLSGIGLIFILFAFGFYYIVTTFATANKDMIQYSREETAYQRQKHDSDMILLTTSMTRTTDNMASLIVELRLGREATDKEAKARQEAFDKRTEQQHSQIKELHDIIIKKMMP